MFFLRTLSEIPHLAGTPADKEQADYIKQRWLEAGLDRADLYPYDVLLSYPQPDADGDYTNRIVLYDGNDDVVHESPVFEPPVRPEQNRSDVVPPFNGFAKSGSPKVKFLKDKILKFCLSPLHRGISICTLLDALSCKCSYYSRW